LKIHVMSDLHLEFASFAPPVSAADVVVLAGDIGIGTEGIRWAKANFEMPVIYVPGNHEYYDEVWNMDELLCAMRLEAEGSNVHMLDRNCLEIDGTRFIGTTLWTDLHDQPFSGIECGVIDSDAYNIRVDVGEYFTGRVAQPLFEQNKRWLRTQLDEAYDGATVAVTHHAPSANSLHPQYAGNPWNSCFITDMESFMGNSVNLWVHGHTHNNFDYEVNGTRVICNPRGYPHPFGGWENPAFDERLIVDV